MESSENQIKKELLAVPEQARTLHAAIVESLKDLEKAGYRCLEPSFKVRFTEILDLYDHYRDRIVNYSSMKPSCRNGCAYCCYHWVEDVNSFEAEILSEFIKTKLPHKIASILKQCDSDIRELKRLQKIVTAQVLQSQSDDAEGIDETDLLLSVFYQMKRPCPLLDDNGSCMVYEVRPLTCRIYMSFSDPEHCSPEYINDDEIPTYLLNLEEDANEILDRLHFRYQRFPEDTGLRSLLVKYLTI